jgi:Excreted virulence factor EspC, type VII ESX diderm
VGEIDAARVDVPAVLGVARQYQAVADIVESAARTHLTGLAFDGAAAGRAYVDRGDALRASVDHIANQLRGWGRASVEIAATLRASADRYADADSHAARRLG